MNSMQKEFDIVVAHLFKQGRPSIKEDGVCAYRGKDNTMCAVGCRIPNSRYTPMMDNGKDGDGGGFNADALVNRFGKRLRKELTAYRWMFLDLQRTHDSASVRNQDGYFDKDELEHRLKRVATNHGLKFTRPQ